MPNELTPEQRKAKIARFRELVRLYPDGYDPNDIRSVLLAEVDRLTAESEQLRSELSAALDEANRLREQLGAAHRAFLDPIPPADFTKGATAEQRAKWAYDAMSAAELVGWPGATENANRVLALLRDLRGAELEAVETRAALEALRPKEGEVLVRLPRWTRARAQWLREPVGLPEDATSLLDDYRIVGLLVPRSAIVEFPPAAGAEKEPKP